MRQHVPRKFLEGTVTTVGLQKRIQSEIEAMKVSWLLRHIQPMRLMKSNREIT
jgi:hypothetical protein